MGAASSREIKDRGWKPLPLEFLYQLTLSDKRLKFFHHEDIPVKREKKFNWAGEINIARKLFYLFSRFHPFVLSCLIFHLCPSLLANCFLFDTQVAYSYIPLIQHEILHRTRMQVWSVRMAPWIRVQSPATAELENTQSWRVCLIISSRGSETSEAIRGEASSRATPRDLYFFNEILR